LLPIGLARQKFRCAKKLLAGQPRQRSFVARSGVARSAVCEPKSADPTADEARDDSDVTVSRSSVRHSHTLEPNQAGLLSWTARRRSATRACVIESRRVSRCTFAPARLYTSRVLAVWNAGHLTVRFARRCGPPAYVRQTAQATPPTSRHPRRPEGRNAARTDHRGTSRPASRRDARRFEAVRRRCGDSGTVMCARA
jgi:hypothetical protein